MLITLSVIAPTFTTLYSGVPAVQASLGLPESRTIVSTTMIAITIVGLILAILRFDLWLLSWLVVLAALLPPLVVPLAVESTRRRRGYTANLIPIWTWLPGAFVSTGFTMVDQPLAPLLGLLTSAAATILWYIISK
jgi:hypothetical protein